MLISVKQRVNEKFQGYLLDNQVFEIMFYYFKLSTIGQQNPMSNYLTVPQLFMLILALVHCIKQHRLGE